MSLLVFFYLFLFFFCEIHGFQQFWLGKAISKFTNNKEGGGGEGKGGKEQSRRQER